MVCLFKGLTTPFILRNGGAKKEKVMDRADDHKQEVRGVYHLMGDVYIDGLRELKLEEEDETREDESDYH